MKNIENSNYQPMIPYNLQFFAEDASASVVDNTKTETDSKPETVNSDTTDTSNEKTYEDAMAEIAAAQAEVKKLKSERDNALKRAGDATKQLRAKMTEAELEAEKKAAEDEEHKAYVKDLEDFQKKTLAKERYVAQYGLKLTDLKLVAELAEKAATAEVSGDMDALSEVNMMYMQAFEKQMKAAYMGNRGRVNIGDGEDATMTKEEILAIQDREERIKQIASHPELFERKK